MIDQENEITDAMIEAANEAGYIAYADGVGYASNPHVDRVLREAWLYGWETAERRAKEERGQVAAECIPAWRVVSWERGERITHEVYRKHSDAIVCASTMLHAKVESFFVPKDYDFDAE